ncbi:transposase [Xanthomonas hyacinthi]|uniref:transposase n=1 Tax=Xanthomonas hyacinthi TaxID=56455 RepID=UPI0013034CA8
MREVDAGVPVNQVCRKHGFNEASYCLWRSTFGGRCGRWTSCLIAPPMAGCRSA